MIPRLFGTALIALAALGLGACAEPATIHSIADGIGAGVLSDGPGSNQGWVEFDTFVLIVDTNVFVSGVFFPSSDFPAPLQAVAALSPLTHAVHLVRPLSVGQVPPGWPWEVVWITLAAGLGVVLGGVAVRRKMVV